MLSDFFFRQCISGSFLPSSFVLIIKDQEQKKFIFTDISFFAALFGFLILICNLYIAIEEGKIGFVVLIFLVL